MIKKRVNNIAGSFGIIIVILVATFTIDAVQAETGKGEDTFKAITTIFKANKSKDDLVANIAANNGEASRVKFPDTGSAPKLPNPTALTPSIIALEQNGGT